jgi:hypothetical protein
MGIVVSEISKLKYLEKVCVECELFCKEKKIDTYNLIMLELKSDKNIKELYRYYYNS